MRTLTLAPLRLHLLIHIGLPQTFLMFHQQQVPKAVSHRGDRQAVPEPTASLIDENTYRHQQHRALMEGRTQGDPNEVAQ